MLIAEGVKIPADGEVVRANDLCVDESSLTGEAEGVWKVTTENAEKNDTDYWRKDYCYASTLVTQGSAMILVDKIGVSTEYGKIGMNVASAPDSPSPLQNKQANLLSFVQV
jgi:Ca2+-transporting ATPase